MNNAPPPPADAQRVMRILDGIRPSFALGLALELHLFEHIAALHETGATTSALAQRAGISERGAQALLDAFVALELVTVKGDRYANTELAMQMLVPGSAYYVGEEHGAMQRAQLVWFQHIGKSVRSGQPAVAIDDPAVLDFWTHLTPMIQRMNRPIAALAMRELQLDQGAPALLDVGGGMAVYSQAILAHNPRAQATQADWPHINRGARAIIEKSGFQDRFTTLDGDMRELDFGDARFDVAVLSNIVHQESPASNRALLQKLHRALKPGGQLIIAEFVVEDGRTGPAWPLLFNLTMLPLSEGGKSYERHELAEMVQESGFAAPRFVPAGPTSTLIFAKKR